MCVHETSKPLNCTVVYCMQHNVVDTVNDMMRFFVRCFDCSDIACVRIHCHPASLIMSNLVPGDKQNYLRRPQIRAQTCQNKQPTYMKFLAWAESGSTAVTFSTQVPMGEFSFSMACLTVTLNTGGSLVSSTSIITFTEWRWSAWESSLLLVSTVQRLEDFLSFTLQEK